MTTRRTILKTGAVTAASLAAGTVVGTSAKAAAPSTMPDVTRLQAALDRLAAGPAVAALAEARDVDWVWRGTAGIAELGTSRPVPAHGRFRAGSTTKSFVSAVMLQLAGEGRLSLDDPLARWYPGIVPNSDRITVRNLLQHTSGIFNYTDRFAELYPTTEDFLRIRYHTWTPSEILALIAGRPPLFEPGTDWAYSNTDYTLLALVIRRVTGRDYASEVRRRILRPLRLDATEVPGENPFIRGAHSHAYLPVARPGGIVEPVDTTVFNPSVAGAAGEMISTTAEVNRFYGALMRGRLLHAAQLAEMLTSFGEANYGLGLEAFLLPGIRLWGHSGDFFGYLTYAFTTEDGGRQLTVSINPRIGGDPTEPLIDLLFTTFGVPLQADTAAVTRSLIPSRRW